MRAEPDPLVCVRGSRLSLQGLGQTLSVVPAPSSHRVCPWAKWRPRQLVPRSRQGERNGCVTQWHLWLPGDFRLGVRGRPEGGSQAGGLGQLCPSALSPGVCRWLQFMIDGWGATGQNNPSACPHMSPSLQIAPRKPWDSGHHGDGTSRPAP